MTSSFNRTMNNAMNSAAVFLIGRLGLNLQGAEILSVTGRRSGVTHSLPVNPLALNGTSYLVSPRGETQWVRNIRVSHTGQLRRGKSVREFRVVRELPEEERIPVLRAYIERWHWQVGKLMNVPKTPTADNLKRIASKHPVLEIEPIAS